MSPRLPRRVALTGGIASGKSYCLAQFKKAGIPVIDADELAREVVAPGTPGLEAIANRFGSLVISDGRLDRTALGALVFADPQARADLERIVHPLVYARIAAWFTALERATPPPSVAIADIPLLFESGHAHEFDCVIVTSCTHEQQVARLMTRDGISRADALRRLAAQMPLAEKVARASIVIDTSRDLAHTDADIARTLAVLRQSAG